MLKYKAYAKINLFLDVISRRPDGFHNIKSVMHSLSLCDDLTFAVSPSDYTDISVKIKGNDSLPTDENNLVFKAAVLYLEAIGKTAKIEISLEKNIPSSAGLGGGSSDAAATLCALNDSFDKKLSTDELLSLGERLGSDVPFCILGGTALCEGRGEVLSKIPFNASVHFVIAIGSGSVSTPKAYAALDARYSAFDGTVKTGGEEIFPKFLENILSGKSPSELLFNVFEETVCEDIPEVAYIKSRLVSLGALGALMSGSGPSVFGVYPDRPSAKKVADLLVSEGYRAFVCLPN